MAQRGSRNTSKIGAWRWVDESEELEAKAVNGSPRISSFDFVPESGISRPQEKSSRKVIRAHATRYSRQSKRSEQEPDVRTHDWRIESINPASKSIKIISPLNGSPRIHSIDPFGTLPGSGSRLSDMLMSYWSNNIIHSRVAVKHMPGWMSYAVSSPPLYYSTMFMSALRLLLDLNTPEVQLALLHYQGEAIRAVNKCLQDNNKYVETETICAVACLVQGEGIMGLNPSCLAHLNGLEFLIRQRGGLEKLGMSGIAQPYILSADICSAINLKCGPRFSVACMACGQTHRGLEPTDPSLANIELESHLANLHLDEENKLNEEVVEIQKGLRQLSSMLDDQHIQGKPFYQSLFSDWIDCVDRRTVLLIRSIDTIGTHRDSTHLGLIYTFGLATIILSYMILRDLPQLPSMAKIALRITDQLKRIDIVAVSEQQKEMLLWIHAAGAAAAMERDNQLWFEESARWVCKKLSIHDRAGVDKMVQEFAWPVNYQSAPYTTFWKRVFYTEPEMAAERSRSLEEDSD